MSALLKLAVLLFFMVLLPVLAGAAADRVFCGAAVTGIRPGTVLRGYFLSFALCEAIALPVLFLTPLGDFVLFARIYAVLLGACAAAGLIILIRSRKRRSGDSVRVLLKRFRDSGPWARLFAAAAVILYLIMLYKAYTVASFDGDDAYYVTQSVLSVQTGTMYRYLPYTGITTSVDTRHALALFPMWTAALSSYSGIHPTIIAHSMEPLVFITLSALVFLRISGELFDDAEDPHRTGKRAAFMAMVFLLWIFGYVSLYTPETFLLTRTWQGKSVLANLLLPAQLCCLLRAGKHPEERRPYAEAFLLCLSCGLFTSMAPVLLLLLTAAGVFFLTTALRDRRIVLGFLPAAGAALVYLVMIMTA